MKRLRLGVLIVLLLAVVAGVVSMVGQWWGAGELASPPAEVGTSERVRVEVLNAAGIPGLARGATDRLRDAGFDVVFFGNGRGFEPESSLVLDRVGRREVAAEVARALGIPRVVTRPDTTLYLEVTVVLGKDWAGATVDTSSRPSLAPEK
ncbi:MAG: LytR C-terminal domain-containing protein [Gemmatimonadetes bacterium]|nr:LytR C-terminal domain-containing protein [Gemmatimonadota bacterium]